MARPQTGCTKLSRKTGVSSLLFPGTNTIRMERIPKKLRQWFGECVEPIVRKKKTLVILLSNRGAPVGCHRTLEFAGQGAAILGWADHPSQFPFDRDRE